MRAALRVNQSSFPNPPTVGQAACDEPEAQLYKAACDEHSEPTPTDLSGRARGQFLCLEANQDY